MQHHRRDGGGPRPFHHGGGTVNHFDIQIGRAEGHLRALSLDQDVGEDRNRIAAFHHRLGLCQRFQQRAAFNRELHSYHPFATLSQGTRDRSGKRRLHAFS